MPLLALLLFPLSAPAQESAPDKNTGRLGLILDKRTDVVFFVENGSGAQEAGIRIGDKLLEVDGSPITGHYDDDLKKIMGAPGSVAQLKVRREDQDLVFQVTRKTIPKGDIRKVVQEAVSETPTAQPRDFTNRGAHSYKEYLELMAEENRQLVSLGRSPKSVISQEQWNDEIAARSAR